MLQTKIYILKLTLNTYSIIRNYLFLKVHDIKYFVNHIVYV